jgi:hypothetical protein
VPPGHEPRPEIAKVVDLSVERDPHRAVFVGHRLVGDRRQVDDAQTAEPQPHAAAVADKQPFVVGTTVHQAIAHRDQRLPAHGSAGLERQFTADAAHQRSALFRPPNLHFKST